MKTVLLFVSIVLVLCSAQTYLSSGYTTSMSLDGYGSYNCFYLSGSSDYVLNIDITITSNPSDYQNPLALYISTSSNSCPSSNSYNIAVTTFADKNRLRYSYVINSYDYQYISVYSTSYDTISYTIKPTLYYRYSSAIDMNNGTVLGQASNSYYTYYYFTVNAQSSPTSVNLEYSGDYVYFYVKEGSYPSSSDYDAVMYSSSNSYTSNYTITTYNTGTQYYYVAVLTNYNGYYGNYKLKAVYQSSSASDCSTTVNSISTGASYTPYINAYSTNYYSYYAYAGQVVSINVYDTTYGSSNSNGFTVSADYGSCPLTSYSYTMQSTYNQQTMTFVAQNDGYYILAITSNNNYNTYLSLTVNAGYTIQLTQSNSVVSYLDSSRMTVFQVMSDYSYCTSTIFTDSYVTFARSTLPGGNDYSSAGYSDTQSCTSETYYWGLTSTSSSAVTVTGESQMCDNDGIDDDPSYAHSGNGLGLGLGLGFATLFLVCVCCACAARHRRNAQMRHHKMQNKETHIELSAKQPVPMVPLENFTPAPVATPVVPPQQNIANFMPMPIYGQPPMGYYSQMGVPAPYVFMNQPMYVPMVNGTHPFIQQQQQHPQQQ